jgi:D-glycero-beta-D-manno-heptose-7-phosphate kinase
MTKGPGIFEAFNKLNVLVIGDVMVDRYLQSRVSRISPEAPVPIAEIQGEENRLGGAGNVALNLKALGATPILYSVIGQDEEADRLLDMLPKVGIANKHILQSPERNTTVKIRVLAGNQQLIRLDRESTHDLSDSLADQLLNNIRETLETREVHAILLQDYNKGVLSPKVIREVILESVRRDIPIALDPKAKNFWAYKHVNLFKPNLKEIRAQVPMPVQTELKSLEQVAAHIRSELGNQHTMITLSEKGLFWDSAGQSEIAPTQARDIADVCGAGDTVISVATLALALKLPMSQIALLSNLAGGQVCEKVGVVPVDKAQLEKEYLELVRG